MSDTYVPPDPNELTAHKAVAFAPGGTQPPNVTAAQLDNPPRIRVASVQPVNVLPNVAANVVTPQMALSTPDTPALISPPAASGVKPIPLYVTTRPKDL